MDAVIFAKPPVPGHVKTRLARSIGDEAAAGFAAAALSDTIARLSADHHISRVVLSTPTGGENWVWSAEAAALPRHLQPSGDLGRRMTHAIEERLLVSDRVVVWGADAPHFPPEAPRALAEALETSDVVLCPSEDGGFYALGSRIPLGRSLEGIGWSRDDTLEVTHRRLLESGFKVSLVTPCFDVDTRDDLCLLVQFLRSHPERAPLVLSWVAEWGLEVELGLGQPI